jgi:DNA-binding protein H-NS
METSKEIGAKIIELFEQFKENNEKDSKAAAQRARKALGEIKKLVTSFRKASVEENKAK